MLQLEIALGRRKMRLMRSMWRRIGLVGVVVVRMVGVEEKCELSTALHNGEGEVDEEDQLRTTLANAGQS